MSDRMPDKMLDRRMSHNMPDSDRMPGRNSDRITCCGDKWKKLAGWWFGTFEVLGNINPKLTNPYFSEG